MLAFQPGNIVGNGIIVLRMICHGAEPHATWGFCCNSRDSAGSHQRSFTSLHYDS